LWGFGDNHYGQLGTGDTSCKSIPVMIMSGVRSVAMEYQNTVILKQNGTLWKTGYEISSYGEVMFSKVYTPIQIFPFLHYGVTVSGGTGSGSYLYRSQVTVTANDSTGSHRVFNHWGGTDSSYFFDITKKQTFNFNMPRRSVSFVARYRDLHFLSVTGGSGSGWYDSSARVTIIAADSSAVNKRFDHWGGADSESVLLYINDSTTFIMPNAPAEIHAVYSDLHTLTVTDGSGSGNYYSWASVAIVANDSTAAQRGFGHWGGPDSSFVTSDTSKSTTFTMPNNDATIKAVYGNLHSLTVNGGKGSGSYIPQIKISVSANDSTSAHRGFDHWGGADSISVLKDTVAQTTFIMPDREATLTATYHDKHYLTVTNGTGSEWFDKGYQVSIDTYDSTAAHRAFDHWGGTDSVSVVNDTAMETTFSMPDRDATITAVYSDMYYVTITNGTGSGWYCRGTKVTITANDSTAAKRMFDHWSGADSALAANNTNKSTTLISQSRPLFLTATYDTGYKVTYDKNNGDVDASPTQSSLIASGYSVSTFPTQPKRSGYCFAGWNLSADGSGDKFSRASIITADITVYAQWATAFSTISTGCGHSMVLSQKGDLLSMGYNFDGALGNGNIVTQCLPVFITSDVSAISGGRNFSMILKQDKTLWATGWDTYGQLGTRSSSKYIPVLVTSGVINVSAGYQHTMFIKEDNTLWATGYNVEGELGDGTLKNKSSPVQIMADVLNVSAGYQHSMIIKQDNTLWATGGNSYGQLGVGDTLNRSTPVQIMSGVLYVYAGGYHTMILKQDSTLWATGRNDYGQLGDNTTVDKYTPVQIMSGVSSAYAGEYHTLILKNDHSLWVTGSNDCGELGDKTTYNKLTPVYIMSDVSAVSAGSHFSIILKQDGTVWGTGNNANGALGDGTTTNRLAPVQVMPLP
ncbi:MAG TPA: hypothetical protein DCO75_07925, partial [Fibrobacteres bacterium]|nr:hypothetical protein [Fibrobacterota bacterium]